MYEAFYGFKEKPFSMLPDPGFLYLSKKHQAALTLLEYGLLNHVGFCVISGEAGAGKTTILRALLERISDDVTVGLITNTHQSFGGLLDWVLSAFDLHQPDLTHVEMHQIFMEYLIEEYANSRTVLLIVDEAQNMKADALEELRMLSNVNSDKDQLMQVVLAGQPALKETLRMPELMQFAQRIAVDYHLEALNLQETCGYIQHRLVIAGAERDVFTPAACARIHSYSGGTPRLINLLCETVMVYGFADQVEMIDVDLVDEMVLERMKDSVVPIVNRDIAKQDCKEINKDVEKDFPWIRPKGSATTRKPNDVVVAPGETKQIIKDHVKPNTLSREESGINKNNTSVKKSSAAQEPVKVAARHKPIPQVPKKKHATSTLSRESSAALAAPKVPVKFEKNTVEEKIEFNNESREQIIKYGAIAGVFSLILIVLALLLNDKGELKTAVVKNEAIDQALQSDQEEARLWKLEVETLKKERDKAMAKIEEEKRAKQEIEKLEVEKREAEKAALAIKAKEDKLRLEQKKRMAEAKEIERKAKKAEAKAKRAEAKAKEEAELAKREAAQLEKERIRMKARLEEEIRLKEHEGERRLELELQEEQRQALQLYESAYETKEQQGDVEDVIFRPKKNLVECSGPTARFKAGCR